MKWDTCPVTRTCYTSTVVKVCHCTKILRPMAQNRMFKNKPTCMRCQYVVTLELQINAPSVSLSINRQLDVYNLKKKKGKFTSPLHTIHTHIKILGRLKSRPKVKPKKVLGENIEDLHKFGVVQPPKQSTQSQNHTGKDYRCYYRKI